MATLAKERRQLDLRWPATVQGPPELEDSSVPAAETELLSSSSAMEGAGQMALAIFFTVSFSSLISDEAVTASHLQTSQTKMREWKKRKLGERSC